MREQSQWGESKYFFLAHEYAAGSYFVVIETAETSITNKGDDSLRIGQSLRLERVI